MGRSKLRSSFGWGSVTLGKVSRRALMPRPPPQNAARFGPPHMGRWGGDAERYAFAWARSLVTVIEGESCSWVRISSRRAPVLLARARSKAGQNSSVVVTFSEAKPKDFAMATKSGFFSSVAL